jgi:DNA-cytosine methyltransferase
MKYYSFFSGIGCFEYGLHTMFPDAQCIGYSEINKDAIQVYESHFRHTNLGDITKIDINTLQRCDLVVAGFPCTDLSSLNSIRGDRLGLDGSRSGLFFDLIRILKHLVGLNPDMHIIIENVKMAKDQLCIVQDILNDVMNRGVYTTLLDGADFGVQRRKRYFFTDFYVGEYVGAVQTWSDILDPLEEVQYYKVSQRLVNGLNRLVLNSKPKNDKTTIVVRRFDLWEVLDVSSALVSRWDYIVQHSDTGKEKCPTISTSNRSLVLFDRRFENEIVGHLTTGTLVRHFTNNELERLFMLPEGWVGNISSYKAVRLLGNAIVVGCINHVLKYIHDS